MGGYRTFIKSKKYVEPDFKFLAFDSEAYFEEFYNEDQNRMEEKQILNFGYITNGKRQVFFNTAADFVKNIINYNKRHKKLFVYAYNLKYDMITIKPFIEFQSRGYNILTFNFTGAQFIIFETGEPKRKDRYTITFVSATNFFQGSLSSQAHLVNMVKMSDEIEIKFTKEFYNNNRKIMHEYCRRDTLICWRLMYFMKKFCKEHEFGEIGITAASTAVSTFRTKFMEGLTIHRGRKKKVVEMEQAAYHGGRTECFFIGGVDGCRYLDRNSMYPAEMIDNYFPIRYSREIENPTPGELLRYIKKNACVLIHARIKTERPIYAQVYGKNEKLIFPVGEFIGYFVTPEVLEMIEHNEIVEIYSAHLYQAKKIFHNYIDFMSTERVKYKAVGDKMGANIFKLLQNTLYGKFAERRHENKFLRTEENFEVDSYIYVDENFEMHNIKKIGFDVFESIRTEDEAFSSFTCIAAHVTAYARMHIGKKILELREKNIPVYYCDTDSIITNNDGYNYFEKQDLISSVDLGKWDDEKGGKTFHIDIFAPKDYNIIIDNVSRETKLKGVPKKAKEISTNVFAYTHFSSFNDFLKSGYSATWEIEKTIRQKTYDKGIIEKSGWVTPFRLYVNEKGENAIVSN